MNAKNKITLLFLLVISLSMYTASLEPVSAASINITSNMNNSQIQTVLNNAASGDTIKFLGKVYSNIQLTINKTLNIITSVGTKLTGSNSLDSAVFLINGSKASGTQISGFSITGQSTGILVNNTSNVTISGSNISSAGSAVAVNHSSGTVIKKDSINGSETGINISNSKNTEITGSSILNSSKRGVGIYNSSGTAINNSTLQGNGNNSTAGIYSDEGAVYLKSSNDVKISGSQIKSNSQGVTAEDASNVTISNNTIDDNYGEGILLKGKVNNITVANNEIKRNANGIQMDYSSGANVSIKGNTITDNTYYQKLDDFNVEDSGNGINYGVHYQGGTGEAIEHNVIMANERYGINAHDSFMGPIYVGSNWYGTSPDSYHVLECKITGTAIKLNLANAGNGTYLVYFTDGSSGYITSDLPPVKVTLASGNFSQTSTAQNGWVLFQISPNLDMSTVTATSDGITVNVTQILSGGSFSGSGSGTSGGSSVSPPTITATSTKNKATGVSRTKATAIKFSENILKSVNWSKVYIKNLKTGQKCKITKWVQGNHIYISTNSKKAANTWYQVYIPASAVKNNAGHKLAKSYTWKFKTGKY